MAKALSLEEVVTRRDPTLPPLDIVRQVSSPHRGPACWCLEVRCACGAIVVITYQQAPRWRTCRSCTKHGTTHGHNRKYRRTRAYNSWVAMINRCTNPNQPGWENYGGRGIKVCDRWRESFENFFADMGEPPPEKSLDRFPDDNGSYDPTNCRWATRSEQAQNSRAAKLNAAKVREIWRRFFSGETCKAIAQSFGVYPSTIEAVINGRTWKDFSPLNGASIW